MNNNIGVLIRYKKDTDIALEFRKAKEMEITSCQLCIWDETLFTPEAADAVKAALASTDFKVTAVWGGWGGPCEWNFSYGPSTIGLVPAAYRESRLNALKKASDFAEMIGVDRVITHVGFIPENPDHPDFAGTVGALRNLCRYMKAKNQYFLFETGQETPVTMLRTIEAIGYDNVGINFDTANLILYGKANTLDALDVFGQYVMETHIKDGFYPTNGMALGKEAPAGQGKANLPAVVKKLDELGFNGAFTIEREISGDQQIADIKMARDLLREWMK
ncbi:MAG: sugar phosphate isomerase/epimerase [Clostridia bacterium]|nr:sugar phosphate isomerase/epimerase [Clostridia bacterium]